MSKLGVGIEILLIIIGIDIQNILTSDTYRKFSAPTSGPPTQVRIRLAAPRFGDKWHTLWSSFYRCEPSLTRDRSRGQPHVISRYRPWISCL